MCTTYGYLLKHTPVRQMPMTRQQAGTHDTYLPYCPHYATHEACARPRLEGKSTQFCCKWHERISGACCLPPDSRPGPSQATKDNRHRLRRGEESTQAKYTKGNSPPWVHAPPVPNQYTNVKAICVLEPCTLRPPTEAIHKCKGNLCIGAMYPPPPTEAIHKCKGHLCNWLTPQCV